MEDRGEAQIKKEVETAFNKRWENYARTFNLAVMRGAAAAHLEISKTTQDIFAAINRGEEISEKTVATVKDLSAMAQHMHNALYTAGQNYAPKKQEAAPIQVGRLMINAGPPPLKNKITRARIQKEIPAAVGEFRELPSGS